MDGYLLFDHLVSTQDIRRLATHIPFHVEVEQPSINLARDLLEIAEQRLIEHDIHGRFCPAAVVFSSDPPQRFTAADITLHDHPTLLI